MANDAKVLYQIKMSDKTTKLADKISTISKIFIGFINKNKLYRIKLSDTMIK